MNTIPKDFNASSLAGIQLLGISFTANQIRLMFDKVNIVVEGRMILKILPPSSDAADNGIEISPQAPDIQLLSLIESHVVSARIDDARLNLSIAFSNDRSLVFIGDEPYECYTIQLGDRTIIV